MMRTVQAGPVIGLIGQLAVLSVLAGTVGFGATGWLVGTACGLVTAAGVAHGLSRSSTDIVGAFNPECVVAIKPGGVVVQPTPGFLSAPERQEGFGLPRLYFANSDVSGLSLFEEAQYRGVQAAERALSVLGG